MLRPLRPLVVAFGFLTRLPVNTDEVQAHELGRAVACFPLVGLWLGAVALGLQTVALQWFGAALTSVLVVSCWALMTGGLHLDGVSDLFDGLGGGRGDRERMLAIMRDSRIGSHGAVALILVLVAKLVAVNELLTSGASYAWPLLLAPVCSRWAAVPLIACFRYARSEGLGKSFHEHTHAPHVVLATLLTLAALAPFGTTLLLPAACAMITALLLALWIHGKLGGLTGDVHGAAIELAEVMFLITCHVAQRASGFSSIGDAG